MKMEEGRSGGGGGPGRRQGENPLDAFQITGFTDFAKIFLTNNPKYDDTIMELGRRLEEARNLCLPQVDRRRIMDVEDL